MSWVWWQCFGAVRNLSGPVCRCEEIAGLCPLRTSAAAAVHPAAAHRDKMYLIQTPNLLVYLTALLLLNEHVLLVLQLVSYTKRSKMLIFTWRLWATSWKPTLEVLVWQQCPLLAWFSFFRILIPWVRPLCFMLGWNCRTNQLFGSSYRCWRRYFGCPGANQTSPG